MEKREVLLAKFIDEVGPSDAELAYIQDRYWSPEHYFLPKSLEESLRYHYDYVYPDG